MLINLVLNQISLKCVQGIDVLKNQKIKSKHPK